MDLYLYSRLTICNQTIPSEGSVQSLTSRIQVKLLFNGSCYQTLFLLFSMISILLQTFMFHLLVSLHGVKFTFNPDMRLKYIFKHTLGDSIILDLVQEDIICIIVCTGAFNYKSSYHWGQSNELRSTKGGSRGRVHSLTEQVVSSKT